MADSLRPLLEGKQIVVCVGAGGVGKTTVAAAIALGFAQQGQRVLCITIDPAKRDEHGRTARERGALQQRRACHLG